MSLTPFLLESFAVRLDSSCYCEPQLYNGINECGKNFVAQLSLPFLTAFSESH